MKQPHIGVPRRAQDASGRPQFVIHTSDLVVLQRELHLVASRAAEPDRSELLEVSRRFGRARTEDVGLTPDELRLLLRTVGGRTALVRSHRHDRERRLAVLRELMPLLSDQEQETIRREVRALLRQRQDRDAAGQ